MRFALGLVCVLAVFPSLHAAADAPKLPPDGHVHIDVADAELRNVILMMGEAGQVNLVMTDDVKGKITLKLDDVDWREALGGVLAARGLGIERMGNVIFIDTLDHLAHRSEQRIRRIEAQKEAAPLVTVIIPVRYAKANDLVPIVRGLLSPRGTVAVDKRTNSLIVTDGAAEAIRERLVL
ncbi:MAG: secretin N-terminal domain-containing protein [Myxococcota bacterium]